jgi:hypothetical protein
MDRLQARVSVSAAVVAAGLRVSFSPAIPFSPRFWWYDVHQVEGAV